MGKRFGQRKIFAEQENVWTWISNALSVLGRHEKDSLTGGLNSNGFIRQTEKFLQSTAKDEAYDLLFFDIKNFKAINELLGVRNGDSILKYFYEKLRQAEFAPIFLSRSETDHFVCLAKRQEDAYASLEMLCQQTLEENGKRIQIHMRCGIFQISDRNMPVAGMMDRARLAEKHAGEEYKTCYTIYTTAMKEEYIDEVELAAEIALGIERGEFNVYYQPIVRTDSGEVVSAEALVRWHHPQKGILFPDAFIPILEKREELSRLDACVLESVRRFQMDGIRQGRELLPVSVNLFGDDFHDRNMMQKLMQMMQEKEMEKEKIRFEIMETSYTAMDACSLEVIKAIRSSGGKILIDDFGKEYSSLGLLRSCDIDILKIDREFIQEISENPKARIILRSIIDMAEQLGLETIAEGVETEEQRSFLQDCGCDYVQGFYFFRPLPEEEFAKMLKKKEN